jgi:hypothetical protein
MVCRDEPPGHAVGHVVGIASPNESGRRTISEASPLASRTGCAWQMTARASELGIIADEPEDAGFGERLRTTALRGNEHDVANIFVSSFLRLRIADGTAIRQPGQIRNQCALKQTERNEKPVVVKDLVV